MRILPAIFLRSLAGRGRTWSCLRSNFRFPLLLLFLALGACSIHLPKTSYYILSPEPLASQGARAALSVGIEGISPSHLFAQERIAFRSGSHELGFYDYSRWAVAPDLLLGEAAIDLLSKSGRFQRVAPSAGRADFSVIVGGRLREIYEDQRESTWKATLSIVWELRDGATGSLLAQKEMTESSPMAAHNQEAFAEAMSVSLRALCGRLADLVVETKAHPPASKPAASR